MACKVVFYYNQEAAGFSETYYHNSSDPKSLVTNFPRSFLETCAFFRSQATQLVAVRASLITGTRQSYMLRPSPGIFGQRITVTEPGPDVVSTTAVFKIISSGTAERRVYIRGLADVDTRRYATGGNNPSAVLVNGTNNFFLQLSQNGLCIKKSARPPTAGLLWSPVQSVQPSLANPQIESFFVLVPGSSPFLVGDVVNFNGINKALPRFPRQAVINSITVTGGISQYYFNYGIVGGVVVTGGGLKATKAMSSLELISGWFFERFGEHKTGRPFGLLRGRSRSMSVGR